MAQQVSRMAGGGKCRAQQRPAKEDCGQPSLVLALTAHSVCHSEPTQPSPTHPPSGPHHM